MSSSRLGASVVAFLAGDFTVTAVECPRAFEAGMREVETAREGAFPVAKGSAVRTGGCWSRAAEGRAVPSGEALGRGMPGDGWAAPWLAGACGAFATVAAIVATVPTTQRKATAIPRIAGALRPRTPGSSRLARIVWGASEWTAGGTVTLDGLGLGAAVGGRSSAHASRADHSPLDRASSLGSLRIVSASFASSSSSRLMLSRVDIVPSTSP